MQCKTLRGGRILSRPISLDFQRTFVLREYGRGGFPLATENMSIRVPRGTKREPNVIRFKTSEETRVDDVVATLEDLYVETAKPVPARQIGDVVGMQPPQTLIYLHQAKDAGLANPVPTNNPKWTKGWVPGSVEVPTSLLEHGAELAAQALGELYDSKPISGATIAKTLQRDVRTVRSWLTQAETMGLVTQAETRRGWIPQAS